MVPSAEDPGSAKVLSFDTHMIQYLRCRRSAKKNSEFSYKTRIFVTLDKPPG